MSQAINKAGSQVWLACALFLGIIGFYSAAAFWFPMAYIWATYEDLIGEWVQFWSIVVAMVLSARLAMMRWRYRWFFGLLAISCLYVALEEISWGQRLVGYSSPQYFRANNLQGETNVHNFLTGPYGTQLKAFLSYTLAIALAVYGLVYPLVLRLRFRLASWFDAKGLAAPPLFLWPFFVTAAYLECSPFGFNEAEIAEVLVGFGLALTTVHYLYARATVLSERPFEETHSQHSHRTDVRVDSDNQRKTFGISPSRQMAKVTALVLVLSVATTASFLTSPSKRARIQSRLDNGVRKFAGRYARHDQWSTAYDLYKRVLEKEPHRVSILRSLAQCSKNLGDAVRFDYYLQQALTIDLTRLEAKPNSASTNRSLVRTYRMMKDESRVQEHLSVALQTGLRRINHSPDSATSAYSIGQTYLLMNQPGLALEQLSKAYKYNPASKKYRRAYYTAKKRAPSY